MELKSIYPWAALIGIYLALILFLEPIDRSFGNMAPGIFLVGAIYLSIRQIWKYIQERKHVKNIKSRTAI